MTTSPDKFDEMATNLYVTWVADRDCDDCTYVTAAERTVLLRAIAALVRRAVEEARAEEREACARVCEAIYSKGPESVSGFTWPMGRYYSEPVFGPAQFIGPSAAAAAIRARGSKENSTPHGSDDMNHRSDALVYAHFSPLKHVVPALQQPNAAIDFESLARACIDAIVSGGMIRVLDATEPVVFVWSGNAVEQIAAHMQSAKEGR